MRTPDGELLQVKAMRRVDGGRRRTALSPDYTAVVVVIFTENLRVESAWRIPRAVEARFKHNDHVNGRIIRVSRALFQDLTVMPLELSEQALESPEVLPPSR